MANDKWIVYGEYGGSFSRLEDAKLCAKEASKTPEHDYKASVFNNQDGMYYFDYEHGKLVRDGWTVKLTTTGKKAKFNLDGKIVEKPIYKSSNGTYVIKHQNQYITINNPESIGLK